MSRWRPRTKLVLVAIATLSTFGLPVLAVSSGRASIVVQPLLAPGSKGPLVAAWQQDLNRWLGASGYPATVRLRRRLGSALAVDGSFGPKTEATTLRSQHEGGIHADGVVGLVTWTDWIGANITCCGAGFPDIGPGNDGADVAWWQLALNRWLQARGIGGLVVDGTFGPGTKAATGRFQAIVGLPQSGHADRTTWRALSRYRSALELG